MARITYIHGLPKDEVADRARKVPPANFLDYGKMTEGQLRLLLLYEQLSILAAFYPDVPDYARQLDVLGGVLAGDRAPASIGATREVRYLSQVIAQAQLETRPAIQRRGSGLGNIPMMNCQDYAVKQMYGENVTFGDLITNPFDPSEEAQLEQMIRSSAYYQECQDKNEYIGLFNEKLEKTAHHILYTYIENPNAEPQIVASKTINHRLAVAKMSQISGLSGSNLKMWLRNGVQRQNVANGTEPFTPEKAIEIMKTEVPVAAGISGPFLVALPAIIKAIAAAVGATVALIAALKASDRQQLQSTLYNIGLPPFGPEEGDWMTGPGGASTDVLDQDWVIPAAIAAGAYFMLK